MGRTDDQSVVQVAGGEARQRSVYLDAVRAAALVRVVIHHITQAWVTTVVAAMPLMFFIAGTLYAASLDRRPAKRVIGDRYRRILLPYWVYLACMVALWAGLGVLGEINAVNWVSFALPVLSFNGPVGPGEGTDLAFTWMALWYLQLHLLFSLVGPLLRRAQQNNPRRLWIGIAVAFLVLAVVLPPAAVAVFYMGCWVLGYHYHDGTLQAHLRRTWVRICAVSGPLGLLMFVAFHDSAPVLTGLGGGLLGVFWLCLAVGLQPRIEPWLVGRRTRSTIHWFSQRSLTIYLWHLPLLYAVIAASLPGSEYLLGRTLWVVALVPVVVVALGWAEDWAARRPLQVWPRLGASRSRRVVDLRSPVAGAPDRSPATGAG